MTTTDKARISELLREVPAGQLRVTQDDMVQDEPLGAEGKGCSEVFPLFDGVAIAFHRYLTQTASAHHHDAASALEVNYCHCGRLAWHMREDRVVYMGGGDASVQTMDDCADSSMDMPLGYFEGATVSIDLDALCHAPQTMCQALGLSPNLLRENVEALCHPAVLLSCAPLQRIFSDLFEMPQEQLLPYCRLRVLELLLWLQGAGLAAVPLPELLR